LINSGNIIVCKNRNTRLQLSALLLGLIQWNFIRNSYLNSEQFVVELILMYAKR